MTRLRSLLRSLVPALLVAMTAFGQQRIDLAGAWEVRAEPGGDADYRPILVPSAFETVLGTDFDGIARYRRVLPLPEQRAATVRIEFAAVATHAMVFCNGRQLGEHLGGWTPFRVDVTDALSWNGNDVLEVVVDERVGHNTQGFLPIIQPHFGGIWQGVTLCLDDGPVIDRLGLFSFGSLRREAAGKVRGSVGFRVPLLGEAPAGARLRLLVQLLDGERVLVSRELAAADGVSGSLTPLPELRPWSTADPALYTVRFGLLLADTERDRVELRVGFRSVRADGTRVLWNDAPLQLRGLLHWGYSPPALAPPTDLAHWRRQLEYIRSLGFNCIKCCLWIPPRGFYELCDQLGMLVWQEYPTWHPQMDQAHKQELLREYGEFFQLDRNHPSVAFRSITCETGPSADLDVVQALYDACKAAMPDSLVVDDSSWIGWQRVTDFWDEHPYGNNSWFPGRLEDFRRHIRENGEKPLLLGECFAADTWIDRAAWLATNGDRDRWWRPLCWDAQKDAEAWLTAQFGVATVASLRPLSLAFGMRNRKFQIEQLRIGMPDAGYVVSVARDFQKARMGLYDDLDQPKWSAADWQWHRDTMLCLDLPWHGRALPDHGADVPVRVSHYGSGALAGTLRVWCENAGEVSSPVALAQGGVSTAVRMPLRLSTGDLTRVRVHAKLTGSHAAENHWDLWVVPTWAYRGHGEILEVDALTPAVLDQLVEGARVLLRVGDQPGAPRTEAMWFLKGAPFAPPHPAHRLVSREALLELSSFDLESGRVMPWQPWRDQVDPILAFWETHDIANVRFHLHAFDTRVGKGRLLVTSLRHEGDLQAVGPHLLYQLREHLTWGPAPQRELSARTIAALRAKLSEKTIDLPVWRFRTDPDDQGRAARWFAADTDTAAAPWRDLRAGSHWENQAEDLRPYTGIAWYRIDVDVPADWRGLAARAVFDGVDDSFELWLNGEPLGAFGDPATKTTIWLEQQVGELGEKLRWGDRNTLVLRVVDHAGAGGLWKPARLTTGPVGNGQWLLR